MKKLLRLKAMLLLCALIAGSGSVWAEDKTNVSTVSTSFSATGDVSSNFTQTGDFKAATWNLDVTWKSSTSWQAMNTKGSQVGSGSKPATSIVLTGEDIPGTIKSVKVNSSVASGGSTTIGVVVGENTFKCSSENTATLTTSAADYTFTGSGSGDVVVTWTQASTSKAIYIKSITVTYEESTSSIPTPTLSVATNSAVAKGTKVTITNLNTDNYAYFFTTDGTTPTYDAGSGDATGTTTAYSDGITINSDCTVKVLATDYSEDSDVATYEYTLNREDANLVAIDDFSLEVSLTKGELYTTDSDGAITFESSDATVATVSDAGVVTAIKPGTATITISQAMTEEYAAAEATVTVTVTAKEAVDPVGPAGSAGKFVKVTDTDDITDGQYLIVYETGSVAFNSVLETLDAVGNTIAVTISNGEIAETDAAKAAMFTIDVANGTLLAANGQYVGRTSNSNGFNAGTESMTNTFSIDGNGNAVITSSAGPAMKYNKANDQARFRYYKSGQQDIQLYKYVAGTQESTFDVTVGDAKWRTLVSSKNVTLPEGLAAYIVTASSASSATLTAVSKVKANTAVLLNGNAGDYTLTVTEDDVTYDDTNLLQVSTETTGNGVYVLADKDGVGFYKWTGGSLGAGRVYLPAPAAAAREFLSFDFEETTGINNVESSKLDVEGFYNLAGQRVAQPTKGLYIVNGKKVIIK